MVLGGKLDLRAPVSRYLPGGYTHFRNVLARSAQDAQDAVPRDTLDRISVAHSLLIAPCASSRSIVADLAFAPNVSAE